MAKTTETTAETTAAEKVAVSIPRATLPNEDPNFFVSVNGKNYLLPKGKKSMVPPEVAYEIERSFRAEEAYFEKAAELQAQGALPANA